MTDDLVKRLRGGLPCGDVKCVERSAAGGCTCGEAADRIEKLEAALRQIEHENTFPSKLAKELGHKCGPFATIAREALEGKGC